MRQIVIRCEDLSTLAAHSDMLEAAKIRIERWSDNPYQAFGLVVNPTDRDGWTEWHLVCASDHNGNFVQGSSMLLALIKRTPASQVECHS